jgi:hypothetical protein
MARRRKKSQKSAKSDEGSAGGAQETSSGSSVGFRDMTIIIAAGSGLIINVMVGQIYLAPWWVRLASGLVMFALVLVSLQFLRVLVRWCRYLIWG